MCFCYLIIGYIFSFICWFWWICYCVFRNLHNFNNFHNFSNFHNFHNFFNFFNFFTLRIIFNTFTYIFIYFKLFLKFISKCFIIYKFNCSSVSAFHFIFNTIFIKFGYFIKCWMRNNYLIRIYSFSKNSIPRYSNSIVLCICVCISNRFCIYYNR